MNYQAILERILVAVDTASYLTPSAHVDARQRDAMALIAHQIQAPDFDPAATRALIRRFHTEGRIDEVMKLSALNVVAASPLVQDWEEAARLAGEQELAALRLGGPNLESNLASVDRHRGVLFFLQGSYEVALDYFTRAFERQRTAENIGNILCTLVRLGELAESSALVDQVRSSFPSQLVDELDARIEADPDLALLRTEAS